MLDLYEARFGVVLDDLVAIIRATDDDATLRAWLKLAGTGTAEDVAAHLRGQRVS
jgi:uncharacterized protein with GYD domain